jgi:ketosteroid isomerase-like protein
MSYAVPRAVVEAFYAAYAARDIERAAAFIHDDVQWSISGPVDLLAFCGVRRGKAAVLDMMGRQVSGVFNIYSFVTDTMLVEGDRVATFNRLSARMGDGRVVSYRLAHFMRFSDDKVIENRSLIDSFDAAEQVLGYPLGIESDRCSESDTLVTV